MTCIVGIEQNGTVYLGSDTCASDGHRSTTVIEPKCFKIQNMIIGYTTSFRYGQLLQYSLIVPQQNKFQTDHEFLCTDFVDAVITCLSDGNYLASETDKTGCCLIGYKGLLYTMQSDNQIRRAPYGCFSVGSGKDFAHGVLLATRNMKMTPRKRLQLSLETASEGIMSVSAPYHFISLRYKEK